MCDIDKFIWCFYINYIPLNSVTRIIAYPIPRCDSAINEEFGLVFFFWLWDAPMGYHQFAIALALASQEKLAFQGPNAIKWTHTVMPFGPMNGPAMFINFIHDVNSQWKALAQQSGLVIDDNTNTKIIVDDIFSWSDLLEKALLYMECQLRICQAYRLSLGCAKVASFPSGSSFSVLMSVHTEIALPCQSINFLNTGLNPCSSGTLQRLSGLHSFTACSSLNVSFELPHFAT
jgi:hypothetical protein